MRYNTLIDENEDSLNPKQHSSSRFTYDKNAKNCIDYSIPNGITHLMMWLGGPLPEKRRIKNREGYQYSYCTSTDHKATDGKYTYVNYIATLKGECEKMKKKGEKCILVYDSKMIKKQDEEKLKDIISQISNCYLVDYEVFKKHLSKKIGKNNFLKKVWRNQNNPQYDFIKHIDHIIEQNKVEPFIAVSGMLSYNDIGNLVDCVRMLLLHNPKILKQIANDNDLQKTPLDVNDCCLLYHDFDMIQRTDKPKYEEEKNIEMKTLESLGEQSIVFCSSFDNGAGTRIENGIIFANSKDDKNSTIDHIISDYLKDKKQDNTSAIYHYILENRTLLINSFFKDFRDEGHRTWSVYSDYTNDIGGIERYIKTGAGTDEIIVDRIKRLIDNGGTEGIDYLKKCYRSFAVRPSQKRSKQIYMTYQSLLLNRENNKLVNINDINCLKQCKCFRK